MTDEMHGYMVDISNYCTHSEREPGQFGSWSESYNNEFKSIRIKDKESYPDIVSSLDIKPGEELFVVWLEYSTGDSFGWAHYGRTEPIGIFNNYEDADTVKKLLLDPKHGEFHFGKGGIFSKENEKINHIIHDTSDGQHLEIYYGSWVGYFETLEAAHIERTWMHGV